MAKVCYFTGRRLYLVTTVHTQLNQTKRAVKPNLQKVTVLIDGKPKKSFGHQLVHLNQVKLNVYNVKEP